MAFMLILFLLRNIQIESIPMLRHHPNIPLIPLTNQPIQSIIPATSMLQHPQNKPPPTDSTLPAPKILPSPGSRMPMHTNIAMPSQIYERTANGAQYGTRMYPTQEDAGDWDGLTEGDEARGGDVGFSLTGENLETDLPNEERLPSEESRR